MNIFCLWFIVNNPTIEGSDLCFGPKFLLSTALLLVTFTTTSQLFFPVFKFRIRYVWDTNLTKYRLLYLSALLHQTALQRCIGFARIERMPRIEYWKKDDITGVLVEIFPT